MSDTAAKIGVFTFLGSLGSCAMGAIIAPTREDLYRDPFGSFASKVETASGFQGFGNLLLIVAIISFVIYGFQKILSKETKHETYHGPVHTGDISASGQAKVVGAGGTMNDKSTSIDNSVDYKNDAITVLKSVQNLISDSNIERSSISEVDRDIAETIKKIKKSDKNSPSAVDLVSQLYERIQNSELPSKIVKVLGDWVSKVS